MFRILVIDDEELTRRVVDVMLKSAGYDTVLAVDGNDGLQQFAKQHFDLVICDIFMPNKEGIETLRELRKLDAAVPIIMISSNAPSISFWGTVHTDYLIMAKALGASRTIEKPFNYLQLVRVV